jgi:26S proteasome regulatory subunit N3
MVSSGSGSDKKQTKNESQEDVEMKTIESGMNSPLNELTAIETNVSKVIDSDSLTIEELKEQARQIEKSVSSKEPRFVLRVLRSLATTRKRLNAKVMRKVINGFYTHSSNQKESLLAFIDEPMDTDSVGHAFKARSTKTAHLPLLPELDVYFHLLVLLYLIDLERHQNVIQNLIH